MDKRCIRCYDEEVDVFARGAFGLRGSRGSALGPLTDFDPHDLIWMMPT